VRLATLQGVIAEVDRRAGVDALVGRADAARAAYETLFAVLGAVLAADGEAQQPGWLRPALALCDLHRRSVIDALGADAIQSLHLRTAALADLPDVGGVGSLAEMQDVVSAAINVGAPRYNQGDIRGCCTKYWATAQALIAAPAVRGFAGHARAAGLLHAAVEVPPPAGPLGEAEVDALAWSLRYALDAVLDLRG